MANWIDFTCGWRHIAIGRWLKSNSLGLGCTAPTFVWMTIARLAARRLTRDWRALVWSLARSPAEQLLRERSGSDRAAWSANRHVSQEDELGRPCAEAGYVADGGSAKPGTAGLGDSMDPAGTAPLIEWLIDPCDKPWSGKVHATIVRLDEATQAEFSGIRKNPDVGADDPRCAGQSAGDPTSESAGTARMVQAVGAAQHIARREYRLRGPRFVDFARRIGVTDQSSAYHLVHLHRYRAQIISRCVDGATAAAKRGQIYRYPGWETALGWFHPTKRRGGQRSGCYWLTPPALYRKLNAEFQSPYPLPKGFKGLLTDWGRRNWVNPSFSTGDVIGGKGATAFVRKAIGEQKKGKTSVIVLPVFNYVTMLLEAGAEIRPLGRVPFLDVESGPDSPTSSQHRLLHPAADKAVTI